MTGNEFDVAVVGGGVVGAVLAVALEQAGFATALIEARRPQPFDHGADFDLRQSAIAPAPRHVLEHLGIWAHIDRSRICDFGGMKVWDGAGGDTLHLAHTAVGLPELGHIVENGLLVDRAWQQLANTSVYSPAGLADLRTHADGAQLELDTGDRLSAALVVGAEGANSPVRRAAGIATSSWGYGQRCTVGAVKPAKHHRHIAWQRFTDTGPVAFLPLADGRCSLAWHADDVLADELAELDDTAFAERLTEASAGVLGPIERVDSRAAFDLKLLHAHRYVTHRVALVGDAAHVVHPMAGQGVNLGLLDVAELVAALERGRRTGASPDAPRYLARYQRARMADNLAMLAATDGLKRLFGSRRPVLQRARQFGVTATARLSPLRQAMIRQATGGSPTGAPLVDAPR
ncbi:UbiH/UbiF/VisC/COQ6 family ubiquinone biosynthesis hydroxylase [Salinisphaera orenii]|uniref:UbiH/UbiF/VisC/COQ6 family ubiquinone biosynthesis hydroxylase n=1 Tax=Salinisphaera orenii TaxID=856731 RepID=UPI0013A65B50